MSAISAAASGQTDAAAIGAPGHGAACGCADAAAAAAPAAGCCGLLRPRLPVLLRRLPARIGRRVCGGRLRRGLRGHASASAWASRLAFGARRRPLASAGYRLADLRLCGA